MQLTVLAVDDSPTIRRLLIRYLQISPVAPCECLEAADGVEALEILEGHAADLIFLDWNMPRMGGADFVFEVRKRRETRRIPIVMVTVESAMGKVAEALDQFGVDAFISKPFKQQDVNQKLEPIVQMLGKGRPAKPVARERAPGQRAARQGIDLKRIAAFALLGLAVLVAGAVGLETIAETPDDLPYFWQGNLCSGTLVRVTASSVYVRVGNETVSFAVDPRTRFTSRGDPTLAPGRAVQVRYSGLQNRVARLVRLLNSESAPVTGPPSPR